MVLVEFHRAWQRREEKLPVLIGDARVALGKTFRRVVHRADPAVQEVVGLPCVDERGDREGKIGRRILLFSVQAITAPPTSWCCAVKRQTPSKASR